MKKIKGIITNAIAVDLDGVIFEYDGGWKGLRHFGKPVDGVKKALTQLREAGYKIIIYTCRVNPELRPDIPQERLIKYVRSALEKHGIPFDKISVGKPMADFYIDDRGISFTNWKYVVAEILFFEKIPGAVPIMLGETK